VDVPKEAKPHRLNKYTFEVPTHAGGTAPTFQISVVAMTRTHAKQLLPTLLPHVELATADGQVTVEYNASADMISRLALVSEEPVGPFVEKSIGVLTTECVPVVLAALNGPPGDLHRKVVEAAGDVFYQPWTYNINSQDGEWTFEKQQAYMDEIGRNIVRAALKFLYGDVLPMEDEMCVEEVDDKRELQCAKCGATGCDKFRYLEDLSSERRIIGFNDEGVLEIEGGYTTAGWDEDSGNPRLWCRACGTELDMGDQPHTFL